MARRAIEQEVEASTERLSRWWAVPARGRHLPRPPPPPGSPPRLSIAGSPTSAALVAPSRDPAEHLGLLRLLKDGQEIVLRIPPNAA